MTDPELDTIARRVGEALAARGLWLATAESCTGGWIAEAVTAIAGSSGWFDRGFVTYSNAAKADMLGVRDDTLDTHGAVSEATVREMAAGALARSRADLAVAVSGVAGPGGGMARRARVPGARGVGLPKGMRDLLPERALHGPDTVVFAPPGLPQRLPGGSGTGHHRVAASAHGLGHPGAKESWTCKHACNG